MKFHHFLSSVILILSCIGFMACEQKTSIQTIVHEDGRIQRSITFFEADSAKVTENIFAINAAKGWRVETEKASEKDNKFTLMLTKTFSSTDEANAEMNGEDEAVFRIHAEMTEKFRWFFTYYRYTETFGKLNRMKFVKQEDYFTPEDFTFINRLPAEGKPMSKADSFYLDKLNDRIFEDFAMRGYYEENFAVLLQALEEHAVEQKWLDSLLAVKEEYFKSVVLEQEDFNDQDFIRILERAKVPVDTAVVNTTHRSLIKDFERRTNFMSDAVVTKINHSIQLPWMIRDSNADSVYHNQAYWQPPAIKYTLQDYTMYVEGRSMNNWAVGLSALIVLITGFLFFRKKKHNTINAAM